MVAVRIAGSVIATAAAVVNVHPLSSVNVTV